MCLSRSSIASHWIFSRKLPNCVLVEIQLHLKEIILSLRQCQIVSQPKFNCLPSKSFEDNSELCLSQNSNASHRKNSETTANGLSLKPIAYPWVYSRKIPNRVLVEIQVHLIQFNLKHFRNVSAEIQVHLIEFFLSNFPIVS